MTTKIFEDFIKDAFDEPLCDFPKKPRVIRVLEELEKELFVCGDLVCIPTKKFYEIIKREEFKHSK